MAYQTTVAARWLLSQKEKLGVKFTEHSWGRPSLTDIEVSFLFNGINVQGRGTHAVGDIALEKACAEAIERLCCLKLGISTVGCAIHSNEELAILNSRNEFVERSAFDSFLNQKSSTLELDNVIKLQFGEKIKFWEIQNHSRCSTVFAITFDANENPISLGLGSADSLKEACEKAYLEAIRNFVSFKQNPTAFKNSVEKDHNLWCCDEKFLLNVLNKINLTYEIKNESLSFKTKVNPVSSIIGDDSCNLFFARTVSTEACNSTEASL